jgi:hypothetical protein
MKHKENQTYQLVPGEEGDQHWLVRFLEGPYAETVIQYGSISVNDEEEGTMSFNFFVESSPDSELTSDDVDLQLWAGDILQEIIREAIMDGSAVLQEQT